MDLKIGDLVFIQIDILPFRLIAKDTETWTNHVGIVIEEGEDPMIAESTFPFSKVTYLSRFIGRSKDRRFAVKRLPVDLDRDQIRNSALERMGILYDTGFNMRSKRQFCSRFVHEVLKEAGEEIGKIETLRSLLSANPDAHIWFWRLWYFLSIPWSRQTITPASLFKDDRLIDVI
jgi:hypothetical protein